MLLSETYQGTGCTHTGSPESQRGNRGVSQNDLAACSLQTGPCPAPPPLGAGLRRQAVPLHAQPAAPMHHAYAPSCPVVLPSDQPALAVRSTQCCSFARDNVHARPPTRSASRALSRCTTGAAELPEYQCIAALSEPGSLMTQLCIRPFVIYAAQGPATSPMPTAPDCRHTAARSPPGPPPRAACQ